MSISHSLTFPSLVLRLVLFLMWPAIWLLLGRAGYHVAHYKQRPDKARAWGLLCLVMPFLLPVLTMWKLKPLQPSPRSRRAICIIVVGNLIVIGQLIAMGSLSATYGNFTGVPTCSSWFTTEKLRSEYRIGASGSVAPLNIESMSEVRETPTPIDVNLWTAVDGNSIGAVVPGQYSYMHEVTLTPRYCTASATLSDDSRRTISYSVYEGHHRNHSYIWMEFNVLAWTREPQWWSVHAYSEGVTRVSPRGGHTWIFR